MPVPNLDNLQPAGPDIDRLSASSGPDIAALEEAPKPFQAGDAPVAYSDSIPRNSEERAARTFYNTAALTGKLPTEQTKSGREPLITLPRITGQIVHDAMEVMVAHQFGGTDALGETKQTPPSSVEQIIAGSVNAINSATESLTTPENIAIAPFAADATLAKPVAGYFFTTLFKALPDVAKHAGEMSVTGTAEQKAEAYVSLGVHMGMAAMAGSHAATPTVTKAVGLARELDRAQLAPATDAVAPPIVREAGPPRAGDVFKSELPNVAPNIEQLAPQTAAVVASKTEPTPKGEPNVLLPDELHPAITPKGPETVLPDNPAPKEAARSGAQEAQAEVSKVANEEGQRSAKDIKEELVTEIEQRLMKAPAQAKDGDNVTIDIPGDGTFTVPNNVEALSGLLARAKKIKTDSGKAPGVPKKAVRNSGNAISQMAGQAELINKAKEAGPMVPPAAPAMTGMGAAVPQEFAPARQTATGIKNPAVDAERQARGQPPIVAPQRLANPVVWDRVMAKIDIDPGWQDRLIAELKETPRTPSQDEIVALDHRYVDLQNEYAKATRDGEQAYKDGHEQGVEEAKARAMLYEGKLTELELVARHVGTEWGRSGQMRQRLLKEDFTLAAMESRRRAAKGFEPLSEAEHSEIAALHEQLVAAEAKAAQSQQEASARISMLEVQKALAEAKAAAATGPAYEPRVLQAAEKFAKFMDKKGDDALARIKARIGRVSANVDPTILSDVGILGAAKITRGLVDFAKWTDAMTRDLGEWFREHAQEAWDASQKVFAKENEGFHKGVDKVVVEKAKRAQDIPGRIVNTKAAIKEKAAKGEGSPLHGEVRKLVRLLVEQDPHITRDGLIDAIHDVLKESQPEITRLEAMDAISGRGKFWTPDQGEVSKTVRDLATQIRLVGHQIDVEAGRPLPRTGYQPEKFSEAARREKKQLNELMRRYGVVVTDPASQLASALQTLKTRLEREKADLTERLAKGDFSPRRKPPRELLLDEEARTSKAQVTILREQFQRGNDLAREKKLWQEMNVFQKGLRTLGNTYDAARLLLTTGEFSFVLRQGKFNAASHPLRTAKAIPDAIRAMRNPQRAREIELQVLHHPEAGRALADKLALIDEHAPLSRQEEITMGRWGNAIPIVAAFNRAARVFLNKVRFDTYLAMRRSVENRGVLSSEAGRAIAAYVNESTGRGGLGIFEPAAVSLSRVWFSPRYFVSRLQYVTGHALWMKSDLHARTVIAAEYGRTLVGLGIYYGLLNWYFSDKEKKTTVEIDPRSADFSKVRLGDTRIDPLVGIAQLATFSGRSISGQTKTSKGKLEPLRGKVPYGKENWRDVAGRFAWSKAHPVPGTIANLFSGTDLVGNATTPEGELIKFGVPITYTDIYQALKAQDLDDAVALSLLAFLGEGLQTYGKKKKR